MQIKKEQNKVSILNDKQKQIAYVTFPEVEPGIVNINHTYVQEEYRGLHLAGQLMECACEVISAANQKVILECSYAKHWFNEHKEYSHLIK